MADRGKLVWNGFEDDTACHFGDVETLKIRKAMLEPDSTLTIGRKKMGTKDQRAGEGRTARHRRNWGRSVL